MYRGQYNIRLLDTGNTNMIEYAIRKLNYKSKLVNWYISLESITYHQTILTKQLM